MARGNARAPSQNAYRGTSGQTQTETLHVTTPKGDLVPSTVYTTIDAVTDPDLVDKLYGRTLNTCKVEASQFELAVPVVYHDPAAEVMVLVLGEAHRHREIEERIRVLERLRRDDTPIPAYVKDFAVVFGPEGLRTYLEQKASQALAAQQDVSDLGRREAELERQRQELEQGRAELKRKLADHEAAIGEMRRSQQELVRDRTELERMRADVRQRVIAAAVHVPEATAVTPSPLDLGSRDDIITKPIGRQEVEEIESMLQTSLPTKRENELTREPGTGFEVEPATGIDVSGGTRAAGIPDFDEKTGEDQSQPIDLDDEVTGNAAMPPGSDPLTTETFEVAVKLDAWLETAAKAASSTFTVQDGSVRVALVTGDQLARGLTGDLDVRLLLHRMPSYPVPVLVLGPPLAFRPPSPTQVVVVPLDLGNDGDRAVLAALARKFELAIDIIVRGTPTRRVRVVAPLADNAAYIQRSADDHLRGIQADEEALASYKRARDLVLGAGFDLLAVEHPEVAEFRDDKLVNLETAQALRRAVAIARRFSRPSREDYLVCGRGYPLPRWRQLRRGVLERAVAWGMWMGPELAQVAVSEGLARSRRDLIMKLDTGFEQLRRNQARFDIDADAADDNAKAIAEEAKALGVDVRRKSNGAIKSEEHSVVSGSIGSTPPAGVPKQRSVDELIALLDDKTQRVQAASELCDRGDPRAAAPVIAAVKKMNRTEAVRILGKAVKLGAAAAQPLTEGLASSKAFLRHGCALALALLRTEDGTHAVIDLLLTEPTEIWREIARAIGQIGPTALMPIASHIGRLGDGVTPAVVERVAWAMAHVGVRGAKPALDQMAAGQSVMAPIAKKALELMSNAARDEVRVRPGQASKDVTVNRAFSRRFFEALEADRPEMAQAALHDLDVSGPLELLDEADLIEEDDEEESELDESDLIQT